MVQISKAGYLNRLHLLGKLLHLKRIKKEKIIMIKKDSKEAEEIPFSTCDPAIDEAITFFQEKLDYLRAPGLISRKAIGAKKNFFIFNKTVKEENNVRAINSAMSYCYFAILKLERMKLTPALDREKIERIKSGIPSIDVYTEY
jgi:hypothetical protein